jgi:hypothetical protein
MVEQTTEGSCHRVYGYSITVRVWTSRHHGLLALSSEEGAREDAQEWVAQQMPSQVADAVASIDRWAKDITCAPPCERHEQRTVTPIQYTFRDVTDSVVECTGRYDIDDTIVCEEPLVEPVASATGETAPRAEPAPRGFNPWLLAPLIILVGAVVAFLAWVLFKPNDAVVHQAATTLPTTTVPAATTSVAPQPTLTGTYEGGIAVDQDPFGHANFIGPMPTTLDVQVSRHVSDGVITVQVRGAAPFVTVIGVGNYNVADGSFTATGDGTVTDRQIPVKATLTATVIDGQLTGTLTYTGTPNGPISYRITMKRVA